MKILVVDDDDATRSLMGMVLGAAGHEVDTCGDAQEALIRLNKHTYAALLTDLLMPGMSGLELVRRARARSATLRCVIITGHPAPAYVEPEGVDWVQKPLDSRAVLASLESATP